MRISIYIAISANGLISNSRNVPDWLSPEYGQGFVSICQKMRAVIMGKTTYNILTPDHLPLQKEGTTVVLTTDEQAKSDNPTVVFTKSKATEITEMLEKKGHTEAVIIGGAMAMSEFINVGLVDDIYFVMEPVLFGSGLPMLKDVEHESKLNLQSVTKLNENTVQLHYEIKKQS
ncbi:dihydrofolate reductase family protein [Galbibacter sp. EGI 63066]|uniref:dihydrofolate reductase family protein n=1 Tax=Galbibacter sp. EGI 63066 TaxID=2993559 RepID=UPI0022497DCF|nr:dihydrofolate reductase family protein [Galbibacter sp. EGI 63066]MCX2679777.1 dihydrofolate reductase family protein [Galbibacter sp. EGI 63066]